MNLTKKNQGFTLIELLAVIIILSLIIMISSPTIVSIINNTKAKSSELSYNNIKKSSTLYVKESPYDITWAQSDNDNEYTCVSLETLINEGFLDRDEMLELFKDSEYVIQDNNNLNSISVRLTRNINSKSITKEEIEESATCSTDINLDIEVTPTINSITVKGICTSKNEPNTLSFSKDNINWEGESVTSPTTYTFNNNIKSLTKYTIYAKCTTSTGEYIVKKTTTLTSNYGVLNIKHTPNNACSNDKTITINSTTDITKDNYRIQYKLGNNSTWVDYNEPFKITANTTIYARYYADENNISDYISSTITTVDRGTPSINIKNITRTTNSSTVNYEVTTNSSCGTTSYICKYGTSQGNYPNTATATSTSCKISNLNSGTKYYYQIIVTNANGNQSTKEGEFFTNGKVTIKYNVNGGTITSTTTDTNNNTTYYWKTDSDGTIQRSTDNSTYSDVTSNILYGESLSSSGLANYNNSGYINVQKTGYKAVSGAEWKCLSGCSTSNKNFDQTTEYKDSDFCDASSSNCTVELGVNWKANTYTVSYNSNGGSGTMSSQTATYGQSFTIASNTFTKTGYTFAGWTTNSDGTDDGYNWTGWSGTWKYVNGQYGISNNKLVLYARWKANTYTVSYNSNGGSGTMSSQTATYGQSFTIASNTFTKTGYTFAGWTTNSDGTDDGYNWTGWSGTWKYVNGQYGISNNKLVLYARWSINSHYFDLNWNLDGSRVSSNNDSQIQAGLKVDGEDKGYVSDYYTKHPYGTAWEIYGVKLNGTTISYTSSGTIGDSNTSTTININTLNIGVNNSSYGTVSTSSLYVLRNATYSTSSNVLTLSDGRKVTATAKSATGYTTTFSSWSSTSGTISDAVTVKANFTRKANTYTLTYNNNSGSGCSSKTGTYGSTWGTLCTPTRSGYTFQGWYDGSTQVTKDTTVSGNRTVTAKWKQNCSLSNPSGCDVMYACKSASPDSYEKGFTAVLDHPAFENESGYSNVQYKTISTGSKVYILGKVTNKNNHVFYHVYVDGSFYSTNPYYGESVSGIDKDSKEGYIYEGCLKSTLPDGSGSNKYDKSCLNSCLS